MSLVIILKYFELLPKLYSESHQKLLRTIITLTFGVKSHLVGFKCQFFLLVTAGTDESQQIKGLEHESFSESDDDQNSYFADDELLCNSEFSDEDECIEAKCELPLLLSIQ